MLFADKFSYSVTGNIDSQYIRHRVGHGRGLTFRRPPLQWSQYYEDQNSVENKCRLRACGYWLTQSCVCLILNNILKKVMFDDFDLTQSKSFRTSYSVRF